MINTVSGNLLNSKENIIVHQVNCQGAMGSGIAKQLRDKYPVVYNEYLDVCSRFKSKNNLLGKIQVVKVEESKVVVNLFGQLTYGRQNVVHTDYEALRNGFSDIKDISIAKNLSIAIPYGIGCGLGGGDWNIVYSIIEEVFGEHDVTIYKLS